MSVSDKRLILQSLIFFSFLICQKQRRLANLEISNYTIISRISQEMRRAQCAVLAYAISKKGYLYNLGVTISAALCTIVPTALFSIRSAISRGALQLTETLSIEGFTTMCTVKPSNNFDYSLLARILYDLLSSSSLLLMVMVVAADGAARRKVHPFCFWCSMLNEPKVQQEKTRESSSVKQQSFVAGSLVLSNVVAPNRDGLRAVDRREESSMWMPRDSCHSCPVFNVHRQKKKKQWEK